MTFDAAFLARAWIGLLASRYYRRTHDRRALELAVALAHWMIYNLPHRNGAVAMGPIPWNQEGAISGWIKPRGE